MKRFTILLLVLGLMVACKAEEKTKAPEEVTTPPPALKIQTLYEWPLREGLVLVSSQPDAAAFAAMQANGIRTVINLRGTEEMPFDEAALAAQNGLTYIHIPVYPATLTRAQTRQFTRALADADAYPILVHCSSANRAAMMMAIGEVQLHGTTPDAAIAKARERGLTKIDLEKTIQAMTLE